MLTIEGRNHIRRYLAGWVPAIGQSIAFGVGDRAELSTDSRLHLEATRTALSFITYDFALNDLIFKAQIPEDFVGKIYEMGLYSLETDPRESASQFVTTFDSGSENWVTTADGSTSIFGNAATRLGIDALQQAPIASATVTSSLANVNMDLSGFSGTDGITFAYNVSNGNANQIVFKFMTDASNYYSFSMGVQTTGYKIVETTKGAAVVTGSPNWSAINEIQVATTAKPAGATSVEFDAIRMEDKDSTSLDYILVARKVLPTPLTKIEGQPMDIEFSLDVSLP